MIRRILFVALLLLAAAVPAAAQQFVVISANGKYLVNTTAGAPQPVFLVAEQAFDLDQNLSDSDLEVYLADRAARGINAIWMAAIDNSYSANPPYDSQGNLPFVTADFTNMASATAYWSQLDYVLGRLQAYGMTAILGVAFSGTPCTTITFPYAPNTHGNGGPSGYCTALSATADATLTAYGAFLGARYASYPNIIWLIGGDMDSTDSLAAKCAKIAAGIASQDATHLIAAESIRGQSPMDAWSGDAWLTLNGLYSTPSNMVTAARSEFARSGALPLYMHEDYCDQEHSETPLGVREEAYWAVLSGANIGRDACIDPILTLGSGWQAALPSAATLVQQHLGELLNSREHWLLQPDSSNAVLTGGIGSGSTISVCACTSDGQSCLVYDPIGSSQAPQIAMSHFSGTVHAWWFNPATGARTDLGTFTNSGTHTFTPADTNDWVLALDLAGAPLHPPGYGWIWSGQHAWRAVVSLSWTSGSWGGGNQWN